MLNLAYQLVWNSFQRQGAMCLLWLPLSTKGIYIIVCRQCCVYLAVLSRNPSAVLGVVLLPGWLSAGLVTGIRLSLHLGSFLSFPLGLADSCRMVLAPVIPEPLFLKPVEALSQRTPSPENLQGPSFQAAWCGEHPETLRPQRDSSDFGRQSQPNCRCVLCSFYKTGGEQL